MEKEKLILNVRHVAQIVRRNMITRVKPSGKTYKRSKQKRFNEE
jgi:hypothetical protein